MTTRSYEVLEQIVIVSEIDIIDASGWVCMSGSDLTSEELLTIFRFII